MDRHGRRPALKVGTMLFAAGGALQASSVNQLRLGFVFSLSLLVFGGVVHVSCIKH